METFAHAAFVRTTWSGEIARIEQGDTRAIVTALVLEDSSQSFRQMRGVVIDLTSGNAKDRIYLDEAAIARTRTALAEIDDSVARWGVPGNGCMGAEEFWPLYNWPWNKLHELNVEFCGVPTDNTLDLSGRGRTGTYAFPGKTPSDLAAILVSATEQLKQY